MKKRFIKTPLVGVQVHGAKDVGTRTVNLLMGEHAGEYVRGDIMDANAVIQAFDELKGNVDNNHDSLEEIVDELHNLRDTTDQRFDTVQEKAEEETANRIQGDNTLDEKINAEKQERVNADTQLRNDLTTEINRAKASENILASNIQAEATKRENDDNTIKDNLNAEITRATAKENEIKAEVDVINGDSTTEGSFRKAIADVVGAAPEAYDTLKEIADKLNSNDDLHTAINDAIATKATTVALNEEIARAKAAEAENKAEIAAEAARAKQAEGNNALAIQNEASRATTAETAINEYLNTEIDRAKGQEAYLQNLVNAKADTTSLDDAKAELDKKISDETTRATEEEDELRSLITTEQNRATASENSIANDLNGKLGKKANTADVDTKFTEEKNRVDGELGKKFDKESVAQESGDAEDKVMSQKATSTAIADETTRAKAAEEAILFDVSYNNNGAVFESISALLGDANLSTLIPTSVRHGGMSIRFIQSSDNKYVQYRLMSTDWSITENDWQGVDDEPTAGSDNLVKSGGVYNSTPTVANSSTESDLDISDEYGNVIMRLKDGHIQTQKFNSLTPADGRKITYSIIKNL